MPSTGVAIVKGFVFATTAYLLYAIAYTARDSLGVIYLVPILIVYSPIPGVYSSLEANRTKSLRKAISLGVVIVIVFYLFVAADSILGRGDLLPAAWLLKFLPGLVVSVVLWAVAGVIWSGASKLNTILRFESAASSHGLSIFLAFSGTTLWYLVVLMRMFD